MRNVGVEIKLLRHSAKGNAGNKMKLVLNPDFDYNMGVGLIITERSAVIVCSAVAAKMLA